MDYSCSFYRYTGGKTFPYLRKHPFLGGVGAWRALAERASLFLPASEAGREQSGREEGKNEKPEAGAAVTQVQHPGAMKALVPRC